MAQFRSNENPMFRSKFSEDIFKHKYAHTGCETWSSLAGILVEDVCRKKMSKEDKAALSNYITELKFIPGGRYLYYAGRPNKFFKTILYIERKDAYLLALEACPLDLYPRCRC